MKLLDRLINFSVFLGNLLGKVSGLLVAFMTVLVCYEVFMRYVFNRPPIIADELGAYIMVAVSYLGIAYTFMEGQHVRITFLVGRLRPKTAKWLRFSTMVIAQIFILVMCVASYQYLSFSIMINERSASWLNFPLKYPQATLLIGFAVYSLVLFGRIVKLLERDGEIENAAA